MYIDAIFKEISTCNWLNSSYDQGFMVLLLDRMMHASCCTLCIK